MLEPRGFRILHTRSYGNRRALFWRSYSPTRLRFCRPWRFVVHSSVSSINAYPDSSEPGLLENFLTFSQGGSVGLAGDLPLSAIVLFSRERIFACYGSTVASGGVGSWQASWFVMQKRMVDDPFICERSMRLLFFRLPSIHWNDPSTSGKLFSPCNASLLPPRSPPPPQQLRSLIGGFQPRLRPGHLSSSLLTPLAINSDRDLNLKIRHPG